MTKTAAGDAAPDVMPVIDDDIEIEPASSPASAERPESQGDQGPPPAATETEADRIRADAVQRYRELRDQQAADFVTGDPNADSLLAARGGSPAEQKVTLKVDGRQIEKPLSEVVALAQMNEAAAARLAEAKRLVEEAKGLHRQEYQPEHHQPEPQHGSRREKLLAIAERIQVGDTEEGAEALAELIGDQVDVDKRVDERLAARQREREIAGAVKNFGEKYPTIVNNPLLATAGIQAAAGELYQDLVAVGLPKELLDPWRGNTDALARLHHEARVRGHNVRSADALLEATGQRMSREFNLPTSGHHERRLAMKRAAGAQPRSYGGGTRGMSSAPRSRSAADVISDMRRSRGFTPNR